MYIGSLIDRHDFVFIQEHWLHEFELQRLLTCCGHDDANLVGISAMSPDAVAAGRPHGGCAIIARQGSGCSLAPIAVDSKRIFACVCELKCNIRFLLINVYMPCDGNDLTPFMDELHNLINLIECNDEIDHVIIGGDLNTDLKRNQSLRGAVLRGFCDRLDLRLCALNDSAQVEFTYHNDFSGAKSVIDHFIVSDNLYCGLVRYECLHDGDNLSDHLALSLCLRLPLPLPVGSNAASRSGNADVHCISHSRRRLAWHRATSQDIECYQYSVRQLLSQVVIPFDAVNCTRTNCEGHANLLTEYHDNLIATCIEAGQRTIPRVGQGNRKAGWAEHVGHHKAEAIFWNRLWVNSGGPVSGWVKDIRDSTRREYRRRAQWVSRNQERLRNERMAVALMNNRGRDFWGEVKRARGRPPRGVPCVDGKEGEEACEHFGAKYKDLYNSVGYDQNALEQIMAEVERRIQNSCATGACYDSHEISVQDVVLALNKLKRSKSDSNDLMKSDHLIKAPRELLVHLSLLLQSLLRHNTCPSAMLLAILVPIPKSQRKSLSDGNNYRSIAISSLIGKIFDHIVLRKHANALSTSWLQFGFKAKHCTTQCTFVLEEVVDHYLRGQSSAHVVLLDATKAFDRVDFLKLFRLLLSRNLCALTIQLLISLYVRQSMRVKWNGSISQPFSISNGVRQGGVLSPVLFCLYMDILLDRLQRLGRGAHIGDLFMGAVGYADDLALIATSVSAMDEMLALCEQFAGEFSVKFNCTKSQSLFFSDVASRHADAPLFSLNGEPIPQVKSAVHLGTSIGYGSDDINLKKAAIDMAVAANKVRCAFGNTPLAVRMRLFRTYCCSFYGSPLWSLSKIEQLSICWRRSLRGLLGLPARTHRWLIPLVVRMPPPDIELPWRFAKFWKSCRLSPNPVVQTCTSLCLVSSTNAASNLRYVMAGVLRGESDIDSDIAGLMQREWEGYLANDRSVQVALASELIDIISGNLILENFTVFEAKMFLHRTVT